MSDEVKRLDQQEKKGPWCARCFGRGVRLWTDKDGPQREDPCGSCRGSGNALDCEPAEADEKKRADHNAASANHWIDEANRRGDLIRAAYAALTDTSHPAPHRVIAAQSILERFVNGVPHV